jgi:hypothetical protein
MPEPEDARASASSFQPMVDPYEAARTAESERITPDELWAALDRKHRRICALEDAGDAVAQALSEMLGLVSRHDNDFTKGWNSAWVEWWKLRHIDGGACDAEA